MSLDDEVKRIKNEYMKEWRAKNKDKVKAAQDRYWIKRSIEKEIEESEVIQPR